MRAITGSNSSVRRGIDAPGIFFAQTPRFVLDTEGVPNSVDALGNFESVDQNNEDRALWLWSPPDSQVLTLPLQPRLTELPVGELEWENVERLFMRLLANNSEVQWAKLYGTRGQDQEGIDAYARMRPEGPRLSPTRPYVVLQSRRVKKLGASDINAAIEDFLEGSWPAKTSKYIFATSYDLTDTALDVALRNAADTLAEHEIEFEPWGAVKVSEMLKHLPELVDDFFGRAWVEPFCGPEGLERVRHRLVWSDARLLREKLSAHYSAIFAAQNAVPRPRLIGDASIEGETDPAALGNDFIVVDVTPRALSMARRNEEVSANPGDPANAGLPIAETSVTHSLDSVGITATGRDSAHSETGLGTPRRTFRQIEALLSETRSQPGDSSFRQAADEWLINSRRSLLVGAPGSGKSSLLRFVAVDLLSSAPQSSALQRSFGGRLPVWLPFGFLTRHLADNDGNSLESAAKAWMRARGMSAEWPLIERAFGDDRLLLLVDGIDEWKSPSAANDALGALESFLGQRPDAAAILSSRPYGVERLTFALPWVCAQIADLDDQQQGAMAAQYLAPPGSASASSSSDEKLAGEVVFTWDQAHVAPFLDELSGVPELAVLARKPLFLALLATSWHGEPMPPRRFALYGEIVDLMVLRHPAMRRRFSIVKDLPLDEREFKTLMEAVAYSLVSAGNTYAVPVLEMQQIMMKALCDDDVLGYPDVESHRMAKAAMLMAEDEFGLLVPQGADHVGFVHRVLLDHLAGRRLARLTQHDQEVVFQERLTDPAWMDVLLASLTAQSNPHSVAELLDKAATPAADASWPFVQFHTESASELIAQALAAEVELLPRKATTYINELIREVETSPTVEHRINIASALVRACANPLVRRQLVPTFIQWLDATRPYPVPAVFALRDLDVPNDDAAAVLLHAMKMESGEVRLNAAHAYAIRFGAAPRLDAEADAAVLPKIDRQANSDRLESLVRLVLEGPTVKTQTAALVAMATGWPDDIITRAHLEWGRQQDRGTLRITSMFLLMQIDPTAAVSSLLSTDEADWVLKHVNEERWNPEHDWSYMLHDLAIRLAAELPVERQSRLADFVLKVLKTNGGLGGDRYLCWGLACGPLADDNRLRDWVRDELRSPEKHSLILYNLARVPDQWNEDPDFARALVDFANEQDDLQGTKQAVSTRLSAKQRKAVLLQGLSGYRPLGVAARLVEEFPDDHDVQDALHTILLDDAKAGSISSIAMSVLGTEAGFVRIFDLLVQSISDTDTEPHGEEQVRLARAVAIAWRRMRDAVAANDAGRDPEEELFGTFNSTAEERLQQARRVLASYPEVDVCSACTSVDAYLGWQIADVIYTWPQLTADYAIAALQTNQHVTQGIADDIHSAALRAHVGQPGPDSQRVIDLAMRLMLFLEPEIREALAHELCLSRIPGSDLLAIFSSWKNDPDDGVRQTVAVGVTQTLIREQVGQTTATAEMKKWRESVRQDLCAYGPNMDAVRRDAWLSMLLLNDLTLIDGLKETIGDPDDPGVELADIYGRPDSLLVTLIADRWKDLKAHFGDSVIRRLSGSRISRSEKDKRVPEVIRALATSAGRHPEIADLVDKQLAIETGRGNNAFGLSMPVIQNRKRRLGADRACLELVVEAADKASENRDPFGKVTKWALAEMLDREQWQIGTAEIQEVLAQGAVGPPQLPRRKLRELNNELSPDNESIGIQGVWNSDRAWQDTRFVVRRAVWSLLYPHDALTQRWLTGLTSWFADGAKPSEGPASWLEISAIAFGAAPPELLPFLIERIFDPTLVEGVRNELWELTAPLLHRVRHDGEAAESLRTSLGAETVNQESPLFASTRSLNALARRQVQDTKPLENSASRAFVSALTLQRSNYLAPADLHACLKTMRRVDPRTVVVDPFLNTAGPMWAAGISLLHPH